MAVLPLSFALIVLTILLMTILLLDGIAFVESDMDKSDLKTFFSRNPEQKHKQETTQ